MKKVIFLFFILSQINPAFASTLNKTLISKTPVQVSDLFYNPVSKNLYYVTPNGRVLVLVPDTKKLLTKIELASNEELYDHSTVAAIDEKNGKIYVSFNRVLFVIDGKTNKIENKIHLIKNPRKIVVKSGGNKIWLLYPDLKSVGIIDDVLAANSKKDSIRFIDFARMTEYAFYDPKLNGVFLHDTRTKHVYFLNDKDTVPMRMNYRKHLKYFTTKFPSFNSVLKNGEVLGIKIPQVKSSYREEEFFWLDKDLRKIFISLDNSILIFNLEKNDFEVDIENLPSARWAFTDNEKLFLIFRLGTTSYFGLSALDLKSKKLLDLTVLDSIEKITFDRENKKIYAVTKYSEETPTYLLTVNASSLNKYEFTNQIKDGLKIYESIITSNEDKRMTKLYKKINVDVNKIKTNLKNGSADAKCSMNIGNLTEDIKYELDKFVTPCRSKDDLTRACIDYRKLLRLTDYLESILVVDFNQNSVIDVCEKLK